MHIASTLAASYDKPAKSSFLTATSPERGSFIALVLVDRDVPIPWYDGSADAWTASNIAEKLYKAALDGTAYVWNAHSIKGQNETTENRTDAVFGFSGIGEAVSITDVIAWTVRDSFHEVEFYNRLRSQMSGEVHAFVFTQNSVIPYLDEELIFSDVKPYNVDGNINNRIVGTFSMTGNQETKGAKGSRVPRMGKNFDQKFKKAPHLTITGGTYAGTQPLAPAACAGSVLRLTGVAAGTGRTIAFAIAESGVACQSWSLFLQDADGNFVDPPTGWSINPATGVITVPNNVAAGTLLKFAVAASLPNGVVGQKNFEVVTTA
ncbi:hypothetical protein BWI93_05395 [Siphonobacter sp. BAB-5385]|uniref:hypothetical protein n=1 Tax=Siphonobacter sp. BAB-5385 TaxID=1864822 RepID=UPI000B9EE38D|nr:hypothetical protein [Siphonobacter sp. BAB-5385]OZI09182.1 hypothetical protein BWI93_05395 [Siphonobacter sp. BAB-5385]